MHWQSVKIALALGEQGRGRRLDISPTGHVDRYGLNDVLRFDADATGNAPAPPASAPSAERGGPTIIA
jgi:hypothetical protein